MSVSASSTEPRVFAIRVTAERANQRGSNEATEAYVVFLDEAPEKGNVKHQAVALMRRLGLAGKPTLVFNQLNGFVLEVTEQQARRLRALGEVKSMEVEADAEVFLKPPVASTPDQRVNAGNLASQSALVSYANNQASSGETLPWGVRAVWQGEDISAMGDIARDSYAFVIDSGILQLNDLRFASTSSWHRSWISGEDAFTDGSGHGTHVAGTLAARANGSGVVGVAPGANLVSLKVFDSSGGGASYSTVIAAIDHAVKTINDNQLDKSKVVINLSLGGGFSSSLDTAVKTAANQGVRFAIAAGNRGVDADSYSPAAAGDHQNVYTISAVDSNYLMPSWSNWDRVDSTDSVDDVDFAAPGVDVLSYYKGGQLAYMSGTSMAAPHMAGLLLMGGAQAGDLVTPYYTGSADPFALGVASSGSATEPEPEPSPEPDPVGDQILWGSGGNDVIIGGGGNDRISGVVASGTSASAMGTGQIDQLTGGAGNDVFVLGDNRGVFYDDRSSRSLGTSDYALIKDFGTGADQLQLRNGRYFISLSSENLWLYWDRNNNGSLNTGGRSRDELVAVLEGVSSLGASDIVWA